MSFLKGGGVARCLQRLTATPPARRESHLGARFINLAIVGVYRCANVERPGFHAKMRSREEKRTNAAAGPDFFLVFFAPSRLRVRLTDLSNAAHVRYSGG
jgi:hypothetical protein